MSELREVPHGPECYGRPERLVPEPGGDTGPARQRIEPRTRAECAADLRQQVVSGWERPSFRNRMDEPLDGRTVPREAVRPFEPARAGRPEISASDACSCIPSCRLLDGPLYVLDPNLARHQLRQQHVSQLHQSSGFCAKRLHVFERDARGFAKRR